MNKIVYIGVLATAIALTSAVYNQKVFGSKLESQSSENISKSPSFGYIQTRNGKIKINANKTYTIYDQNGIVSENISLEELQAKNPELHDIVKESIAEETLMMDAGIGVGE